MNKMNTYSRFLKWPFAVLMGAVLAACGSGGGGQSPILGGGPGTDAAPTVIAVTPLSGATAVPYTTRTITATFSKAMDAATLTASTFTLACPVGTPQNGAVTYSPTGNMATLTLAGNLPGNTLCTATVTTGARDVAGTPLASNFVWTFTTGSVPDGIAPTVIAVSPPNLATGVPPNLRTITATFSEAIDPSTLTSATFLLSCPTGTPQTGAVTYSAATLTATLTLTSNLPVGTVCTGTITTGVRDVSGMPLASNFNWTFTTAAAVDSTPPTVSSVNPPNLGTGVCLQSSVNATFSEAIDPTTINNSTFTLQLTGPPLGAPLAGTVTYDVPSRVATFTPASSLLASTNYTATVTTGVKDLAGNALATNKVFTFTTGTLPCTAPVTTFSLGTAAPFGNLGGTAGTTNTGVLTVVNGNLGSTATATSAVTGYHDSAGDIYTETPVNRGTVTGKIYTCTVSTTGPTAAGVNAASCSIATQARLDAQTLYNNLSPASLPGGIDPGAGQLGGLVLTPGVYKAAGGSFMITGSDLTLDAQGNPNAVFVFQTASTLTIGAPAAPRNIILINGAQAKNVFWRVGTSATINAAGGGTVVGTIIASSAISFSTVGNVNVVTLNGRAIALNASVTLTNTVINVPGP